MTHLHALFAATRRGATYALMAWFTERHNRKTRACWAAHPPPGRQVEAFWVAKAIRQEKDD